MNDGIPACLLRDKDNRAPWMDKTTGIDWDILAEIRLGQRPNPAPKEKFPWETK